MGQVSPQSPLETLGGSPETPRRRQHPTARDPLCLCTPVVLWDNVCILHREVVLGNPPQPRNLAKGVIERADQTVFLGPKAWLTYLYKHPPPPSGRSEILCQAVGPLQTEML